MTDMNSDILSKLRKLKALQDRPGNEHEAAAAALRIRELLEKHNLDIGALDLCEQAISAQEVALASFDKAWNALAKQCGGQPQPGQCWNWFDPIAKDADALRLELEKPGAGSMQQIQKTPL